MSYLLCSSCQHTFPSASLQNAHFTENVGSRFNRAQRIAESIIGKTKEDSHRLQKLCGALRELCAAVDQELKTVLHGKAQLEKKLNHHSPERTDSESVCTAISRPLHLGTYRCSNKTSMGTDYYSSTPGSTPTPGSYGRPVTARTCDGAAAATDKGVAARNNQHTRTNNIGISNGNITRMATTNGANEPLFHGAVAPPLVRKMTTAFDLVSAAVYSLLESVAVNLRANMALLWLRPRSIPSSEMVAPFVVGKDQLTRLANAAPFRMSKSGFVCAVSETGVGVNMRPYQTESHGTAAGVEGDTGNGRRRKEVFDEEKEQEKGRPDRLCRSAARARLPKQMRDSSAKQSCPLSDQARPEDSSECSLLENTLLRSNAAQLLVPVFPRYERSEKKVLAVVHFVGSTQYPFAFSRRNEDMAIHAASLLSTMLSSHYSTMIGEWVNRFYNPSLLHSTSTYRGDLDMCADTKCIDDFASQPLLMYRCENDFCQTSCADSAGANCAAADVADDGGVGGARHAGRGASAKREGVTARERYAITRDTVHRKATAMRPVTAVKDLYKHANEMESFWVSSLQTTTQLSKQVASLNKEMMCLRANTISTMQNKFKHQHRTAHQTTDTRAGRNAQSASQQRADYSCDNMDEPSSIGSTSSDIESYSSDNEDSDADLEAITLSAAVTLPARDVMASNVPVLKNDEMDFLESVTRKRIGKLEAKHESFFKPRVYTSV